MNPIIIVLGVTLLIAVAYVARLSNQLYKQQTDNSVLKSRIDELIRSLEAKPVVDEQTLIQKALVDLKDDIDKERKRIENEHANIINEMRLKFTIDLQNEQTKMNESIAAEQAKANRQKELAVAAQKNYEQQIIDYGNALSALIEAAKRDESEHMKQGFYMVQFTDTELEELKELTTIANKYGRIAVPLRKAVWEVYYQKKVKDMIARVVGTSKVSGIYKITNIHNKKCYIGQAVDIGNRWTTHIKRVIGVESETTNKLYPAMRSEGLENFTFEIVEATVDLKNREAYWQEFYKVKEWGYNVRGEKATTKAAIIEDEGFSLFD